MMNMCGLREPVSSECHETARCGVTGFEIIGTGSCGC